MMVEDEPSVVIERPEVVVLGEHDPALPRRVRADFPIGSVVRENVLGLQHSEPAGPLKRVDVLLKHASITEKPHTQGSYSCPSGGARLCSRIRRNVASRWARSVSISSG